MKQAPGPPSPNADPAVLNPVAPPPYRSGFAALIGQPNVGKSTLLNHIVGQKISIISDKPQTTRNKIMGVKHLPHGQIIFFDTPGIHETSIQLNQRMVKTALSCLKEVDLVLVMVEPTSKLEADRFIFDPLQKTQKPKILIVNKMDQVRSATLLPMLDRHAKSGHFSDVIPISALTGENVERLISVILPYLPEGVPYFPEDEVTDQPIRFLASEIIREKVIQKTHQEIPYVVAIEIEAYQEDTEKNIVKMQVIIFVERDSQKGIIIGEKGRMLKAIGQAAREELENLLGIRIYMDLWVKVKKDWRRDDHFLQRMGY